MVFVFLSEPFAVFFFFGNVDKMTVKGGVFQSSLENKVNTQGKIDMYESHE